MTPAEPTLRSRPRLRRGRALPSPRWPLLLLSALAPQLLQAQSAAPGATIELEPVVVDGRSIAERRFETTS